MYYKTLIRNNKVINNHGKKKLLNTELYYNYNYNSQKYNKLVMKITYYSETSYNATNLQHLFSIVHLCSTYNDFINIKKKNSSKVLVIPFNSPFMFIL